ncbi:MAG: tetratricopeptide repeat protein [Flavobacteriales bacterium]
MKFPVVAIIFSGIALNAGAGTVDSLQRLLDGRLNVDDRIQTYLELANEIYSDDSLQAQTYITKALKMSARSQKPEAYLKTIDQSGRVYFKNYNYRLARKIYHEGLKFSKKNKNMYFRSHFYDRIASAMQQNGLSKQAIPYLDSAITFCPKDSLGFKAELLQSIGRAWYDLGEYKTAMNYYLDAKKIYEKNEKQGREYGHLLHFIGSVFKRLDNPKKALEYYEQEYELAKKIKDEKLEAESLYLMAGMHGTLGDLDKELELNKKSLEIYRKVGNTRNVALLLGNISYNYADRNDLPKAIEYSEAAVKLYEEIGDNETKANVYATLGSYYSRSGQHQKGLQLILKSIDLAKGIETKRLLSLSGNYHDLAWAYARMGNYKQAFDNYLTYEIYKDSLENESNTEFITEIETKYETEKKEQAIALLNKDNKMKELDIKTKNTRQYALLGVIGLMVVMGVVVYRGYRNKKKANILLEDQFRQINEKNLIIEEKNKDITDSIQYAKRIQEAMLPNPKDLNSFFKDSFVFYRPRDIVSGDFYWFADLEEEAILAVADCTGHGVPGAFMSIVGQDILNQLILEKGLRKPSQILMELDKKVCYALNKKATNSEYQDGMDIALCVFDKKANKMRFAGANRPAFIIPDGFGEIVELPANKFSIGGSEESSCKVFYEHEKQLNVHDKVYLFSDGYSDQFGGEKFKKFKSANFRKMILSVAKYPLNRQNEVINDTLEEWRGQMEQTDDVCVVGVMIK